MPPQLLYDITGIDLDHIIHGPDAIREVNPHRGDMEMLQAVTYLNPDLGQIIGYKDVRDDEFWVPGHIPGRPLYPGVLMIEAAAQLASFYTRLFVGWKGFVGFGGATDIRFRQAITPGMRLILLTQKTWERHKRIQCKTQGLVNGTLAFECTIIGTEF